MKRVHIALPLFVVSAIAGFWTWHYISESDVAPTMLSLRIGQPFDEVVKNSTYPVLARSSDPRSSPALTGDTSVTEPAVILCFDDPQHGFVLAPARYALVDYLNNVVANVKIEPMLKKLNIDQAAEIMEALQEQLDAGGWYSDVPSGGWFDLRPEVRKDLHDSMRGPVYGYTKTFVVPKKYSLALMIRCTDACTNEAKVPAKFALNIGIGADWERREAGDPDIWDKDFPGNEAAPEPARFRCPVLPAAS